MWTTVEELTNIVNAVRAKTVMTMQDPGVFPGVFEKVPVPAGNRSYTEPKVTALTADPLTDGVDITKVQKLTDSLLTVTPTAIGLKCVLTRLGTITRSESIPALYSKAITNACKLLQDQDGCAMMDGFAKSIGGGSGTLSMGYLNAALANIRGNATEPDPDPAVFVFTPFQFNDLADTQTAAIQATGRTGPALWGGVN
mgnify:CR=1 FL=1